MTLLFAAAGVTLVLCVYGVGIVGLVLGISGTRLRHKEIDVESAGNAPVVILVPSYNEGQGLTDAVETLLAQHYDGEVTVRILVEDESDTSVPYLRQRFGVDGVRGTQRGNRVVEVALTGLRKKNEKVNWALPGVQTPYVAFLDADHRADPHWLAASILELKRSGATACQSVRAPLDARRLFQFWDSAENHLGNEVLNIVCARLGLQSFFTGTTCVFRTDTFSRERFPNSITEDTFLSYRLLTAGERIVFNRHSGSYEEVAPDFSSYLARRRRWSSGHNQTFFRHLGRILTAPLPFAHKGQLLLHGAYFTLPTLIVILVAALGLFTFFQLTDSVRGLVLVVSLFLALLLSFATSDSWIDRAINGPLAFVWLFGQVALLGPFVYRTAGDLLYFQLLSFPYASDLAWLQLVLILLPLLVLFVGSVRLGRPSFGLLLLYLPTFPLILFLDIFAGFVGFVDFLIGRRVWGKIRRGNSIEASFLPVSVVYLLSTSTKTRSNYWYLLGVPLSVVLLVFVNDVFVFENCGNPRYLLGHALIYEKRSFDPELEVRIRKEHADEKDAFRLRAQLQVSSESHRSLRLSHRLNTQAVEWHGIPDGNESLEAVAELPMAFDTGRLTVTLEGDGVMCRIEREFSAVLKEIRDGVLHVNGEPFVIKGVVPSFRNAQIGLPLRDGLAQIKALGANTIRLYHAPTPDVLDLADELDLMLVTQPDESTWQNIDMAKRGSDERLVQRYVDLVNSTAGHPHVLIDNLGNELELTRDRVPATRNIASALKKARKESAYRFPLSYSTYGIFFDYRVDLFAVNMLDTGRVYWRSGASLAKKKHGAFYASEFGGFVAFHETIDPLIRAARMADDWQALQRVGASGGIFFQSHDNWAQPIVEGYNDPFRAEQADDTRGLWNHQNEPKLVHSHLSRLYADVAIAWVDEGAIAATSMDRMRTLRVTNQRPYVLEGLVVEHAGVPVGSGRLGPGDFLDVSVPQSTVRVDVRYSTHRGLVSDYPVDLADVREVSAPHIYNTLARVHAESARRYSVDLYRDAELRFLLPKSWRSYAVDGQVRENTGGIQRYALPSPSVVPCEDVEISRKPKVWTPLPENHTAAGTHSVRCRVPKVQDLASYTLVLEGTGAGQVEFLGPGGRVLGAATHSYRENRIPMSKAMAAVQNGVLTYRLERTGLPYIEAKYTTDRTPIEIPMNPPRFEKIQTVTLEQRPSPAP
ncbi:MAG: glycosyltransferase family 2 protein [Myxococcota bacterium]